MVRPRRFDEEGLKAYLDDVRPRFLVLRVRADKANIVWGVPLWAAEEIVAFAIGGAAILKGALPLLPQAWRQKLMPGLNFAGFAFSNYTANYAANSTATASNAHASTGGNGAHYESANNASTAAWAEIFSTINWLAGGSLRNVLRVPPGEPYVQVATDNTRIEIVAY